MGDAQLYASPFAQLFLLLLGDITSLQGCIKRFIAKPYVEHDEEDDGPMAEVDYFGEDKVGNYPPYRNPRRY